MKAINLLPFQFVLFLTLLHPYHMSAQSSINPRIALGHVPTPQAADLGRFGDIPVSYYTGRANISIPIQSFTERGVTLDINLTYDTSGLLMNKLPGWVGPGWTLNAGGCITRVLRNEPDERVDLIPMGYNYSNYFQKHGELVAPNGTFNSSTVLNFYNYAYNDYAPDLFYFNFLGKSGYFFLGNDGYWKVSSDDNLVVEFDINDNNNLQPPIFGQYPNGSPQPKTIKGFTLYDDNGNKFIFGGDTLSVEYSIDLYYTHEQQSESPWVATSWYLTKVEDRFGNTLYEFTYERGKYLVQMFPEQFSNTVQYTGTLNLPVYLTQITSLQGDIISLYMESPYNAGQAAMNLYPSLYEDSVAEQLISSMISNPFPFYYLQKNTDSHARFYSATGSLNPADPLSAMDIKRVNTITVRSGLSTSTINYQFSYDSIGRYHLSSVATKVGDTTYGSYSLVYNDYASVPPDYLTKTRDSWGFYNNTTGSLLPDSTACKKGMLTAILYPTGGKSVLEYELNDFGRRMKINRTGTVPATGNACGLRIKSISEYDADQSLLKRRTFDYTNPSTGQSSGEYFADPDDDSYYRIAWQRTSGNGNSSSVIPLSTTLKTLVGYSVVTETIEGIGSHIYCYSNFANVGYAPPAGIQPIVYEELLTFPDTLSRQDFLRGKLAAEYIFDDGGSLKMTKRYEYRTDAANYMNQFVYGFDHHYYDALTGEGGIYRLFYPKYDLQRIATTTEYGNNEVNDTVTYSMTNYNSAIGSMQPPYFRKCSMERKACKGFKVQKDYSYVSLSENKYFIPLVSTTTSHNGKTIQTDAISYATINGYYQPQYEIHKIGNSTPDTLVTYTSYSSAGLPLTYTRKGEYPTRLFWHGTYKDKLLGIVTAPTTIISNIVVDTSSQLPINVLKHDGQSIFSIPGIRATTYIYNLKGKVSATATDNGITNYLNYDGLGRLSDIRDKDNNILQRFTYHYSTGN